MSFFDKMKASVGIGNAKVDAQLDKSTYKQGETIKGEIYIVGGKVEQEINGIYMNVMTDVLKEYDDKKMYLTESIYRVKVSDRLIIGKSEQKRLPFSFTLPLDTPLTITGGREIWIKTELDVSFALDPKDKDVIQVMPSPAVNNILQAVNNLGFQIRKVKTIPSRKGSLRVVQEFEFYPTSGQFRGRLDELEVTMVQDQHGITTYLQVDKKARGLGGFLASSMDADETNLRMTFSHSESLQSLMNNLQQTITRYS